MASAGSPEEPSQDVPCSVSGGPATCPSLEAAVLAVRSTGTDMTLAMKLFVEHWVPKCPQVTVFRSGDTEPYQHPEDLASSTLQWGSGTWGLLNTS